MPLLFLLVCLVLLALLFAPVLMYAGTRLKNLTAKWFKIWNKVEEEINNELDEIEEPKVIKPVRKTSTRKKRASK